MVKSLLKIAKMTDIQEFMEEKAITILANN
jgi:hypothetical protein